MGSNTIRELTTTEIAEVNGGIAPIVGLAISAAGHFMARTLTSSMLGRFGLGLAVYSAAEYVGENNSN